MLPNLIDTHLDAALVDGQVSITGPDGFRATFSLETARDLAEQLIELTEDQPPAWRDVGETYQKPLG